MKVRFCSLQMLRRGDWLIKASTLDDQILIFMINTYTMEHQTLMFYNDESAFQYIEGIVQNDPSNKIDDR